MTTVDDNNTNLDCDALTAQDVGTGMLRTQLVKYTVV